MERYDVAIHLRGILMAAEGLGVARDALLEAAGVDAALLEDPFATVPYETVAALLRAALRRTGSESFGLQMGEVSSPLAFGVLGYYVTNLPTAREAIRESYDVLARASNTVRIELREEGPSARLVVRAGVPATPALRHLLEFHLAVFTCNNRNFIDPAFVPHAVRFRHGPPRDDAAHRRLFRCPLTFGAPLDELVFDAAFLDTPLGRADPQLRDTLRPYVERVRATLPGSSALAGRVRATLLAGLEHGPPSLASTARRMGLRRRTLQHKLHAEGTSYQAVLDDVRHGLALRLLEDPALTIEAIAFRLGFGTAAAFLRAFRRWSGVTPHAWRAAARRHDLDPAGK